MSEPSKGDLVKLISTLNELCCDAKWDALNSMFDAIDVTITSASELVCTLRVTSLARQHIAAYDSLLQRTYDHLKAIGRQPDRALRGLLRDE